MENHSNPIKNVLKNIRRENDAVIVDLSGEIDLHYTPALRTEMLSLLQENPSCIIINMTDVRFMDSSGLAVLLEVLQNVRNQDARMKLFGLHSRVENVFEISRLMEIFEIYPNEQEALAD